MRSEIISPVYVRWMKYLLKYIVKNKFKSWIFAMAILLAGHYIYDKIIRKIYNYPPGPTGLPLFGVLFSLEKQYKINHVQMAKTYGPIAMYPLLSGLNTVLISDCKIAKQVIRQKSAINRFDVLSGGTGLDIGLGILDADDHKTQALIMISYENWTRRRKLLQTTIIRNLTNKALNNIMNECLSNVLCPYLEENVINKNGLWNAKDILQFITFNTIFVSCFGFDKNITMNDELYKRITYIVDNSFSMAKWGTLFSLIKYPHILMKKTYDNFMKWSNEKHLTFKNLVLDKLKECSKNENGIKESRFVIDEFVKRINNKEMSVEEAYIDLYLLFLAGMDTTTHAAEFGVALIVKNSGKNGIINKIRNELLTVMKEKNKDNNTIKLDLRKVNECPLFRAFTFEVLRISSIVPMGVSHVSDRDIWITTDNGKKYRIPKKTMIDYNADYIQRVSNIEHNRYWNGGIGNDVHLKNWLRKYDNDDRFYFVKNKGFITFGSGRRDCVGKSIAIKELYSFLGFIILNYKLSLDDDHFINEIKIKNLQISRKHGHATAFVYPVVNPKVERLYYD